MKSSSTNASLVESLDQPFTLTQEQIERFRKEGYIKLKNVLPPETLAHYGQEITAQVKALNRESRPVDQRDTYAKAFLQVMNIWTKSDLVKEFVSGRRIARIATELIGTRGVRLYHDQALYKEPSGGHTPWHVDQVYWPLSNENAVTAWIPLVAVPLEMGPLAFAVGSQKIKFGRDLTISDESERAIGEHLKLSNFPMDETPFDLGEVSFHYGFTFHRAGPNKGSHAREVMTVIYMDSEMRLVEPRSKAQQSDWDTWCTGAKIGEIINSPLNPVLYERD